MMVRKANNFLALLSLFQLSLDSPIFLYFLGLFYNFFTSQFSFHYFQLKGFGHFKPLLYLYKWKHPCKRLQNTLDTLEMVLVEGLMHTLANSKRFLFYPQHTYSVFIKHHNMDKIYRHPLWISEIAISKVSGNKRWREDFIFLIECTYCLGLSTVVLTNEQHQPRGQLL